MLANIRLAGKVKLSQTLQLFVPIDKLQIRYNVENTAPGYSILCSVFVFTKLFYDILAILLKVLILKSWNTPNCSCNEKTILNNDRKKVVKYLENSSHVRSLFVSWNSFSFYDKCKDMKLKQNSLHKTSQSHPYGWVHLFGKLIVTF